MTTEFKVGDRVRAIAGGLEGIITGVRKLSNDTQYAEINYTHWRYLAEIEFVRDEK